MKYTTTIIIGAGQAGLAMSKHLSDRSIEHVLFERGEIANSWKTERWDSLRLLTPNWQSRLPGHSYSGPDPDGFMNMTEVASFLEEFASIADAPILTNTTVTLVSRRFGRYIVTTNRGVWTCRTLVIATGACNIANVPKIAGQIPTGIRQITPLEYKSPNCISSGGVLVVGASATGVQVAREIRNSGRHVMLSVGEHIRVPRNYRGTDIKRWMDTMGLLDAHYLDVEDLTRARKLSSLQLAGGDDHSMLDLNALTDIGVELVGRVAGLNDQQLQFSGSLANMCGLADLKLNRLLDSIDTWVSTHSTSKAELPAYRYEPTRITPKPRLDLKLDDGSIKTIIWATGYKPDYSWLDVPVLDRKGSLRHDGGIVDAPGLYVIGLPFMRKRKSTLIDGVGDDAGYLAGHLVSSLDALAA